MPPAPTRELAAFARNLKLEDIPAAAVEHAKECILDTLGCGLFGNLRPEGQCVIAACREMNLTGGPAAIWGAGIKAECGFAAMANGIMVESFTMDDLHNRSIIHPGAVTVPVALAMAAFLGGVSGDSLLAAIIAGYETAIRVGLGVSPSARLRGHHPVGICGPLGAAAVAGRMLGLSEEQMNSALGNAGSQSGGLMSAQYGFMAQRLHAGKANHSGLLAAFLARNGFTGTTNILEAEYGGLCRSYAGEECHLERVTEGLGEVFEVRNVGIRPYACAGSTCTTIDGVKAIMERDGITAGDVQEVVVACNESIFHHCGWEYKPDTIITAQFSIQYGAAVTLLEGDASVDQYTEAKIRDPRILELARRVKVVHDPELDKKGASHAYYVLVTVIPRNGRKLSSEVYWAKGTPTNPLTSTELAAKCHRLADGVIGPAQTDRLIERVLDLERLQQVSDLLALLE